MTARIILLVVLAASFPAQTAGHDFRLADRAAAALSPVQAENARPGNFGWSSLRPTAEIEAFVDPVSVEPGGTVALHVAGDSATATRYRVEIYRLGWYAGAGGRLLACLPACGGDRLTPERPPPPSPDPQTGELRAGWPVSDAFRVPSDWVSGYYEARVLVTAGAASGRAHPVYFVVQEPPARHSAILVQVPVNTWQAYNNWGGRSLYDFNSVGGNRANRVSFDRPYELPPMPGAQATPLAWEIQLVRFLEREGYDVSYQTDADTDREPASLLRHRLVMTAGHSEYWTMGMRQAFDRARDQGTNLAFIGSNNAYWHVRYENARRTIVGYKSWADPIADPSLKTVLFRQLDRPECALVGVMHLDSLGRTDYTINARVLGDPWFAGTGFDASSTLPGLVGLEFDAIPGVPPSGCAQPGLTVFFHHQGPPGNADAVRYVAPSGARVFASGTMQWSWALDDFGGAEYGHGPADPRVQQFMRNALADMLRPASPSALVAEPGAGSVRLAATLRPDPRVNEVVVVRRLGPDPFDPEHGTAVCSQAACVDRGVPGHRAYRYAAYVRDEWGTSPPILSQVVNVPNTTPRLQLVGRATALAGRKLVIRARAHDADGDALRCRWRVDGVGRRTQTDTLLVRFRRAGRHRVSVSVDDGYGGVARAQLLVRVRLR